MKRGDFIKILAARGVHFDHHGGRHDIFIHRKSNKKLSVPRHSEIKNKLVSLILDEIPKD